MIERNVVIRGVTYHIKLKGEGTPVIFFHGFLGDSSSFDGIFDDDFYQQYYCIFFDCLGHGKSSNCHESTRYYEEEQVEDINELLKILEIEQAIFIGYSMGGRLALSFSRKYSNKVLGLIIESASPGIEKEQDRSARVREDYKRASLIREKGLLGFLEMWNKLPLFEGLQKLPIEKKHQIEQMKLSQDDKSMAASLEGFSTGKMQNHWCELSKWRFPVHIIVGENDKKFSLMGKRVHNHLNNSKVTIVENCGHAIHMEQSEKFGKIISDACTSILKNR